MIHLVFALKLHGIRLPKYIHFNIALHAEIIYDCGPEAVKYFEPTPLVRRFSSHFATACYHGHKFLIQFTQPDHVNGFYAACFGGRLEMMGIFTIEKKVMNRGLYFACKGGKSEVVKYLVGQDAYDWNLGLFGACKGDNIKEIVDMIRRGANEFKKAFQIACKYFCRNAMSFLSERVNGSQLKLCAASGNFESINYLIARGARDFNGGLYSACRHGNVDLIDYFLGHGASDLTQALYGACKGNQLAVAKFLTRIGANPWNIGLYKAVKRKHVGIICFLLRQM